MINLTSNSYNFKHEIEKQIEENIRIKKEILDGLLDEIVRTSEEFINAYRRNKKVLWFGNGGSAADAQHLSCELVSKFIIERKPLSSIALTTNTSILTAVSNDYCYDKVFERQVDAMAEEGDVLVGITTSGSSSNIIRGLKMGKEKGTINVAFTGCNTDEIKSCADYIIDVPSDSTPRIQECHIMIGHIICYLVEKTMFG